MSNIDQPEEDVVGSEGPQQSPSDSSGGRRWNLGKERSRKVSVKPPKPLKPLGDRPAPPPRPVAGGGARLALPRKPQAAENSTDSESSHTSIVLPGRPVPAPKSFREWVNHPLTMVASALLICISALIWMTFAFSGGGGRPKENSISLTTSNDQPGAAIENLISGGRKNEQGEVVAPSMLEPGAAADGRLLLGTGEMLLALANFLDADKTGRVPPEKFLFTPWAWMTMPMPPRSSLDFSIARHQQLEAAQQLLDMGIGAIGNARSRAVSSTAVRGAGTRLVAEGLALLDQHLTDAAARGELNRRLREEAKLPGLEGAARKLGVVATGITDAQVSETLTQVLPPGYVGIVDELRTRHELRRP